MSIFNKWEYFGSFEASNRVITIPHSTDKNISKHSKHLSSGPTNVDPKTLTARGSTLDVRIWRLLTSDFDV